MKRRFITLNLITNVLIFAISISFLSVFSKDLKASTDKDKSQKVKTYIYRNKSLLLENKYLKSDIPSENELDFINKDELLNKTFTRRKLRSVDTKLMVNDPSDMLKPWLYILLVASFIGVTFKIARKVK